jgi:hypothetical protein
MMVKLQGFWQGRYGVAESKQKHQFCPYSKASLGLAE